MKDKIQKFGPRIHSLCFAFIPNVEFDRFFLSNCLEDPSADNSNISSFCLSNCPEDPSADNSNISSFFKKQLSRRPFGGQFEYFFLFRQL